MRKEKGPIRIPRDLARRARSLKAAAVAVVNRAYLEIVGGVPGRHDEALSAIAGVAGVSKNGVRNWLSNTNRPGRRSAEAIILAYDRDLASRFGLLPLDPPASDPMAGDQNKLAGFEDPGPEVQDPPAVPPAKPRGARPGSRRDGLQDWIDERLLTVAADIRNLIRAWLDDRFTTIGAALEGLRFHIDDRILSTLNELLQVRKEGEALRAGVQKLYNDRDDLVAVVEVMREELRKSFGLQAGAILDVSKGIADLREHSSFVRNNLSAVGVLATKIKNSVEILVEENVPGLPPEATGRPLVNLSVQKKEDGFWLSLDDVASGKSGSIHIETGLPLLRELLARVADPGIPEPVPAELSASFIPRPDNEPVGPPPADGSDRSEPGLTAAMDDLGQ